MRGRRSKTPAPVSYSKKPAPVSYSKDWVMAYISSNSAWELNHGWWLVNDRRASWSGDHKQITYDGATFFIAVSRLEENLKRMNKETLFGILVVIHYLKKTNPNHPLLKIPKEILYGRRNFRGIIELIRDASHTL
jgi:hypothetical protein